MAEMGRAEKTREISRWRIRAGIALASIVVSGVLVAVLGVWGGPVASSAEVTAQPRRSLLDFYKLSKPDFKEKLPGRLKEVSGVAPLSNHEVACIQDEDGCIYIYDFVAKGITRKIPFGPGGDYEEVASVGDTLFVLRSDGVLFEVRDWRKSEPNSEAQSVTTHELGMKSKNNEGLAFDTGSHRLLIAPKSRSERTSSAELERPIFAYDLERNYLLPEPVFVYNVAALESFAIAHHRDIPMVERKNGKGKKSALRFLPSSIAVHPITSEIVVLSGVDRVIAVFDRQGNPTGYEMLDEKLFRQPEGVAFLPNGDMVVTNEGRGKKATLLRFRLRREDELRKSISQ